MDQQKLLRAIVIGVVIAILAVVILVVAKFQGMATEIDSYRSLAEAERREVKYWRDKEGRSHAQAQAAESTTRVLLEVQGKEMDDLRKQIKGLNKNLNNLVSITSVGITTGGNIETSLDSLPSNRILGGLSSLHPELKFNFKNASTFSFTDKWISVDGALLGSKVFLKYEVKDSLTLVPYYKKQGLFRPNLLMIDGISHNPHSSITSLRNISTRQPKPKRIGIGPYIGYGLVMDDEPRFSISLGISVHYTVIRL